MPEVIKIREPVDRPQMKQPEYHIRQADVVGAKDALEEDTRSHTDQQAGHINNRAEDVVARKLTIEQRRQKKTADNHNRRRAEHVKEHIETDLEENLVPGQNVDVVLQPDPLRVGKKVKVGKAVVERVQQRSGIKEQQPNKPGSNKKVSLDGLFAQEMPNGTPGLWPGGVYPEAHRRRCHQRAPYDRRSRR